MTMLWRRLWLQVSSDFFIVSTIIILSITNFPHQSLAIAAVDSRQIRAVPKVRIIEHSATPPLVANCSRTSLQCLVSSPSASNLLVWWTFRGDNASRLPSAHVSKTSPNEWRLSIECTTLQHAGTYACHSALANETHRVHRKEAVIQVFVPVSIQQHPVGGVVRQQIGKELTLKCVVSAYPKTNISWTRVEPLGDSKEPIKITDSDRFKTDYVEVDEATQEGSLTIKSVIAEDAGAYVCHAKNEYHNESEASWRLMVVERPRVTIDRVVALTARNAQVYWRVVNDGNDPVRLLVLEVKNYSEVSAANDSDPSEGWLLVDGQIDAKPTGSYVVQYLAPAVTYGFRLAAVNSAGQSDWSLANATMLSDVPAKITEMQVLGATNETLLIGWKRPHDNGAHISDYQMELRNDQQSMVVVETMNIKEGAQDVRNNYMYLFVGLKPASTFWFQVRACSKLGCGSWSKPLLEGKTSDGFAGAPRNVKIACRFDKTKNANFADVSWEPTEDVRGTPVGFNVTVDGFAEYRNRNNQMVTDHITEWHHIPNNWTYNFNDLPLKPNTNYTIRVCTINTSGCGFLSSVGIMTNCKTPATLPQVLPQVRFEQTETLGQLKMMMPRVSERLGLVTCYKLYVIKMPTGMNVAELPVNISSLSVSSYIQVHYNESGRSPGIYLADEVSSDYFNQEIVVGDGRHSKCQTSHSQEDSHLSAVENVSNGSESSNKPIVDGPLAEATNYSGFIEIQVLGAHGQLLTKRSGYLLPMQTASLPLLSMPTNNNEVSPLLGSISSPATTILLCLISGLVLIFFIFVLMLWLLCRDGRNSGQQTTVNQVNQAPGTRLATLHQKHTHTNGSIPNGYLTVQHINEEPNQYLTSAVAIHVTEMLSVYQEKSADDGRLFQLEFNSLPIQFDDRTTRSCEAQENRCKNRFAAIKCFDQTRVRLSLIDSVATSDYIHANFVTCGDKIYICTQGPVDATVGHFWRMVYEQQSSVIVMLTACEEQGKVNCAQYWADEGSRTVDGFVVTLKSVRIYSDYIIRRFQLQQDHTQPQESREVLQFQLTCWRDFGSAESAGRILRFVKHVNENYCHGKGPLVVHCSAGVGRSGVFIAIDALLPQVIAGFVNVFECILNLRYQRYHLVETVNQYTFIYRALLEFAIFGDTEVDIDHYDDYCHQVFEDQLDDVTILDAQFTRLQLAIDQPKSHESACSQENANKNRFGAVIPYDINRVILPATSADLAYINASIIQGYDGQLLFVATQTPLDWTVDAFWCMVYEQNVCSIIMLSLLDGDCYWPADRKCYKNYAVRLIDELYYDNLIKRRFEVSRMSCQHQVSHYQLIWPADRTIPEDTQTLIRLCEQVLAQETRAPILIHCPDGSNLTGVCLALMSLINQIKIDKRVDVFQTVKSVFLQRMGMFKTIDQLAFLYRAVMDYIKFRNLCDNSDVVL